MNTWISKENELIAEAYNNLDNLLITGGGYRCLRDLLLGQQFVLS